MKVLTVGTTPVLALHESLERVAWSVFMPPSSVEPGNTGAVHVGEGFQPAPITGSPVQGFRISGGGQVGESSDRGDGLDIFQGQIWVVATAAGRRIWITERLRDPPAAGNPNGPPPAARPVPDYPRLWEGRAAPRR